MLIGFIPLKYIEPVTYDIIYIYTLIWLTFYNTKIHFEINICRYKNIK